MRTRGRDPAGTAAVLDQNATTISVMNMAKMRPSARSSPAWCTASAG